MAIHRWSLNPGDDGVLADLQPRPLRMVQPSLRFDQRVYRLGPALFTQSDEAANEVSQVSGGLLASSQGSRGVAGLGRRTGRGQLLCDVVEVDLKVVGQEVDRCALTSRKFDGELLMPILRAS